MWKSVVCAVCGKRGRVEIDDETKAIKSKWAYFGKVTRGKKEIEYWECPECSREFTLEDYLRVEKKDR